MTIHIIDDDDRFTQAVVELLQSVGHEAVVYDNAASFLVATRTSSPGCVICDVRLPGMSGLELQSELARQDISLPIILISGHADVRMAVQAMKAGAVDFFEKPVRPQDLLDAVSVALIEDKSRRAVGAQLERLRARFTTLTSREREVMRFVCLGYTSKRIAAELSVREVTIKVHRGSLMRKMAAGSTAELATMAMILDRARSVSAADYTFV